MIGPDRTCSHAGCYELQFYLSKIHHFLSLRLILQQHVMKTGFQHISSYFLVLIFGLLLPFAFAPYEVFPLAILSPAILFFTCLHLSPKQAFFHGLVFGFGFFGLGVYWVYNSMHLFGGVSVALSVLITAALVVELSFFPALTTYLTTKLTIPRNLKFICAFPAMWVTLEWVRSWLFTGFPWLLLGTSQTNSPLKGYAPLLSVYGVSLAVLITSGVVLNAITSFKTKNYRSLYFNLLAVALIWIFGAFLSTVNWTTPSGKPIGIALVQGNIPQELKWSADHLELSLERYEQLTEPLLKNNKIDIIIWPEAAVPLPFNDAEDYIQGMGLLAEQNDKTIILGIPIRAQDSNNYYNAIISLGKDKRLYIKKHLVPFGEYTPFAHYLSRFMSFLDIPMSDLIPGSYEQKPFIIRNTKILTNICYEIAFPELIYTQDPDIGFILTLTNDAWFGKTSASAQHLQMAQMRAIELGRPAIMATNDGITAIIGPHGEVRSALPQRETRVLESQVQSTQGATPWMRLGTDPLFVILIPMLFFSIRSSIRRKLEIKQPATQRIKEACPLTESDRQDQKT